MIEKWNEILISELILAYMIQELKKLTAAEQAILIKAPALVSVLAASTDGEVNSTEKKEAISFSFVRTFSAHPMVKGYYEEVNKTFEANLNEMIKRFTPLNEANIEALKTEVANLSPIIAKLDREYARILHASLKSFASHVKDVDRSVVEDFIFPLPIPGLTD